MNNSREPIYFYIQKSWYRGKMPVFYESNKYDFQKILENNYEVIKNEIIENYKRENSLYIPQHAPPPYKFDSEKWKICTFYAFQIKYNKALNEFPVIAGVLKKIPGLITAQISVLEPHTYIRPHFGSSNAVIRSHLAIQIPGSLPTVGMKILHEERGWEEGKVLSFCETYRHYVWNYSDFPRIVLLIDTIHPEYAERKYFISCGVLASQILKVIVNKFPSTKSFPDLIVTMFHRSFTYVFIFLIYLQNLLNIDVQRIARWLRK